MLQEREAAAAARLLPAQMLNMGAGLLREARRGGFVSRAEARGFFRAEPQRSLRVLDALVGALPSSYFASVAHFLHGIDRAFP